MPDQWQLQGREHCWDHCGWAAVGFQRQTAPSGYSSKPMWGQPAYPGTGTTLSQERCLQWGFPRGSTSQSSGFLQSEAVSRCPMPPERATSLGCGVQEPSQSREELIIIFPSHCWYLCNTPAQWEGYRMESCLSCQWPSDCPNPVTATLDLGSCQGTQALHRAGSMWS